MKKLTIILTAILLCVIFAGCASNTEPTEPSVSHTIPPIEETTSEYEWAEIECELALTDSEGNTLLYSEDFTYFAVVGSTDEDSYIVLQLTEDAQAMLSSVDTTAVSLTIYGDTVSDVKVSDDKSTVTFGNSIPYATLCEYATTIRGLFN